MKGETCPIDNRFCQESSGCNNCAVQLNQLTPDERLLAEFGPELELITKERSGHGN